MVDGLARCRHGLALATMLLDDANGSVTFESCSLPGCNGCCSSLWSAV